MARLLHVTHVKTNTHDTCKTPTHYFSTSTKSIQDPKATRACNTCRKQTHTAHTCFMHVACMCHAWDCCMPNLTLYFSTNSFQNSNATLAYGTRQNGHACHIHVSCMWRACDIPAREPSSLQALAQNLDPYGLGFQHPQVGMGLFFVCRHMGTYMTRHDRYLSRGRIPPAT